MTVTEHTLRSMDMSEEMQRMKFEDAKSLLMGYEQWKLQKHNEAVDFSAEAYLYEIQNLRDREILAQIRDFANEKQNFDDEVGVYVRQVLGTA